MVLPRFTSELVRQAGLGSLRSSHSRVRSWEAVFIEIERVSRKVSCMSEVGRRSDGQDEVVRGGGGGV